MTDQPTRRLPDDPATARPRSTRPPTQCPRCGGEVEGFQAVGYGAVPVSIRNPAQPRDIWHGRVPVAPCTARVCMECGYTEFYTQNPRSLRREGPPREGRPPAAGLP